MGGRVLALLLMSLLAQACESEDSIIGLDPEATDLSFDIEIVWRSDVNDRAREVIEQAVGRWQAIILEGLPDTRVRSKSACGHILEIDRDVDDLLLFVSVQSLDGDGNTLALTGPCILREGDRPLPVVAWLTFDASDLERITQNADIAEHELAHALGFSRQLLMAHGLIESGDNGVGFVGSTARREFESVGGSGPVPMDSTTAHWRQPPFEAEVMMSAPPATLDVPLSAITIGAMADLGYRVDLTFADPFSLGAQGTAAEGASLARGPTIP